MPIRERTKRNITGTDRADISQPLGNSRIGTDCVHDAVVREKLRTRSKETNWGTAIVTMNSVLHSLGNLVLLLLISRDNRIPPM